MGGTPDETHGKCLEMISDLWQTLTGNALQRMSSILQWMRCCSEALLGRGQTRPGSHRGAEHPTQTTNSILLNFMELCIIHQYLSIRPILLAVSIFHCHCQLYYCIIILLNYININNLGNVILLVNCNITTSKSWLSGASGRLEWQPTYRLYEVVCIWLETQIKVCWTFLWLKILP